VLLPAIDALIWAVLLYSATLLRLGLQAQQISLAQFAITAGIAALAQVGLGYGTVLYRTR